MSFIINADDFGASRTINDAILALHNKGVVSSATIIAGSSEFSQAVEIAKNNPGLDIGVHLCLDGPFNIGKNYSTIIDSETGQFYNLNTISGKLKFFSVSGSEIFKEYCLQIEKVMDHNLKISHLDHHHHLNIYFPALECMIRAAGKYKIKYIRPQKMFFNNKNYLKNIYRYVHHLYIRSRIKTIDGFYSPSVTDISKYENYFKNLSDLLKTENKIIEIMLHPDYKYDTEANFFSAPEVINLINNFKIIRYCDLQ